jgi:hypothetical protein
MAATPAGFAAKRGHPVTASTATPMAHCAIAARPGRSRRLPTSRTAPGRWPAPFAAVVVTNYLWRPLLPRSWPAWRRAACCFTKPLRRGQRDRGQAFPARFPAAPGELLEAAAGLRVVAYEDGFHDNPPASSSASPPSASRRERVCPARYPL